MHADAIKFHALLNAKDLAGVHAFLLERKIDMRGASLEQIIAFMKLICMFGLPFCQGVETLP